MGNIDWDVEKVLLVVMALLILGGVGFIFFKQSEIDDMVAAMPTAEEQLARIGMRYREIDQLERDMKNDEIAKGARPVEYFGAMMKGSGIGQVFSIESPRDGSANNYDGYSDSDWELRVKSGKRSFSRQEVATFLIYIESKTNRMKVSRLRLSKDMSKGAAQDDWEPMITVTNREPVIN
jgi:hypothetical protein